MKKRLLITSIVMMLVVAVALGTSTYAWFTSNAKVTAEQITMTATTNSAAALGISWTDGNYGTAIQPVIANNLEFSPVAPATLSTSGTITEPDVVFNTASVRSVDGDFKFNAAGVPAETGAYTWTDGTHTSFFVKNTSPSNALNGDLTVRAVISGTENQDASKLMRVAIFKYNSNTSKYELQGVLADTDYTYTAVTAGTALTNEAAGSYYKMVNGKYVAAVAGTAQEVTNGTKDYYIGDTENSNEGATTATEGKFFTRDAVAGHAKAVYGSIAKDASVNAMTAIDCVESINLATNLAANTAIELVAIAWMDGAGLGDAEGGYVGNIALEFTVG